MDGNMGIRTITKIEANPALFSRTADNRKLKVAAYCRVSTDEEDQLNSLETQMKYYTGKISENSAWTFAGIYADEGISGTSVDKRKEFIGVVSTESIMEQPLVGILLELKRRNCIRQSFDAFQK